MRLIVCTLLICVLALPALATPDAQHLITPGVGIGSVRLGMTLADVSASLGPAKAAHHLPSGNTRFAFFEYVESSDQGRTGFGGEWTGGLFVICTPAGTVIEVRAWYAPDYVTADGLHTGTPETQVRSALGKPQRTIERSGQHILVYP